MNYQFIRRYRVPSAWRSFASEHRREGTELLKKLGELNRCILVAGCQRSGTTVLTETLGQSREVSNIPTAGDSELAGAYILAGVTHIDRSKRYCLQTTYLNNSYAEYFLHKGQYQLIWQIRNPYSVIYSMIYNWQRYPLNELFKSCGAAFLGKAEKEKYLRYGLMAIPAVERACYAYVAKVAQLIEIRHELSDSQLAVIEYNDLITKRESILSTLFNFLDLEYRSEYSDRLNWKSLRKSDKLSNAKRRIVKRICQSSYEDAKNCLTIK